MLFNSFVFIFGFLPAALIAFYATGRWVGAKAAAVVLSLASLVFYAWWRPRDLPILLFAIVFNYIVGELIQRARAGGRLPLAKLWLVLGLVVDLGLLGYYKYADFVVDNVAAAAGSDFTLHHIVLPLAISFFTFQKIAYLVDTSRGIVKGTGPVEFGLFAAFFPQLLAGPIVHYSEIIPQLREPTFSRLMTRNLVIGLVIFTLGLAKKTIVADTLASYANPLFLHAGRPGLGRDAGVDRGGDLYAPALHGLLGLFRHGDRARADVRGQAAAQFPLAAARRVDHRLLAALAHDAPALPARLRLSADRFAAQPLVGEPRLHRLERVRRRGSACRR